MRYRQGDTKYAYAVGKIRELETRLVTKESLERMLEAEDAGESLKLLAEVEDYKQDVQDLKNIQDFEKMLDKQLDRLYKLVRALCLEPQLSQLCSFKYDIYNLKILIRNTGLALSGWGAIDKDALAEAVAKKQYKDLPQEFAAVVKEAVSLFETNTDAQRLNVFLDRSLFKLIFTVLDKNAHSFLYTYFQHYADLSNIRIFLRAQKQDLGVEFLKNALIEEGLIGAREFLRLQDHPFREFIKQLQRTNYWGKVGEALEDYEKTGLLDKFEKAADDYLIEYIKQAKYLAFGFEPVAGYTLGKENEVKLLRAVLVGKLYNKPEDSIRQALRHSYV